MGSSLLSGKNRNITSSERSSLITYNIVSLETGFQTAHFTALVPSLLGVGDYSLVYTAPQINKWALCTSSISSSLFLGPFLPLPTWIFLAVKICSQSKTLYSVLCLASSLRKKLSNCIIKYALPRKRKTFVWSGRSTIWSPGFPNTQEIILLGF